MTCGIPIKMWLEVLFSLAGVRSLANLLRIYIIRNFYSTRNYFSFMRFVIIDGLIIVWLVYGNMLYYSDKNNCEQNERTAFLDQFMGCILILGYVLMGFYLLVICTLPCLYFLMQRERAAFQLDAHAGPMNQNQITQIL